MRSAMLWSMGAALLGLSVGAGPRATAKAQQEPAEGARPEATQTGAPATPAEAESANGARGTGDPHTGPRTPAYAAKVQAGVRAVVAGRVEAAIPLLREAIETEPSSPDAHYYLAVARRLRAETDGAIESHRIAAERAAHAGDGLMRARALLGTAWVLEHRAIEPAANETRSGRVRTQALQAARKAWTAVLQHAESEGIVNPELPRARIQAIDRVLEQDRAYVEVRERIAAREREQAEQENGGRARRRR